MPKLVKVVLWGVLVLIGVGLGVKEWQRSIVINHAQYRFNMALIERDKGVTFVSFDPAEKVLLKLPFPTDLAIYSRGSGDYSISSLYQLGSYKGEGGKFARQKIQGFMRVPVPGYLVVNQLPLSVCSDLCGGLAKIIFGKTETNLSRFDAGLLLIRTAQYREREIQEEELVRAGVIVNRKYHPQRLQEYVGDKLFDWGIGERGISVAVINASGVDGLGSEIAEFLSNLGLDVIMVRSIVGEEYLEESEWYLTVEARDQGLEYIFSELLGLGESEVGGVESEYRAKSLIKVGKNAKELF